MIIEARILDGPLPEREHRDPPEAAGAVVVFEGIVRPFEDGRTIAALDYQTYDPMAQQTLASLAEQLAEQFGLISVRIWHSRGRVAVGECSVRLVITSRHRKEAILAMDQFIDRLKRYVPIWKSVVWAASGAPPDATTHDAGRSHAPS